MMYDVAGSDLVSLPTSHRNVNSKFMMPGVEQLSGPGSVQMVGHHEERCL